MNAPRESRISAQELFDEFLARHISGDPQPFSEFLAKHAQHAAALQARYDDFQRGQALVARMDAHEVEHLLFSAMADSRTFGDADLETLCRDHPGAAADLRLLHSHTLTMRSSMRVMLGVDDAGPGPIAGRFTPLGELGRGGMSIVLAAWDSHLRRKVALKCLRHVPGADMDPLRRARRQARLLHEAQVLAQLDHPGIVPVYDVVHGHDGEVFVAMLRVRGVDLREIYRRVWQQNGTWPLQRVVAILQRLGEALAYAHGKGVLHRDLKPANVMVGAYGEVYLMDWGLARTGVEPNGDCPTADHSSADTPGASASFVLTDRDENQPDAALRTQRGDVLGTPSYMSPEQADGRNDTIDARSDVYGLGAMLYELLAERAPYVRADGTGSSTQILAALRSSPPEPLQRLAPHVAPELVAVTEKAMARDPAHRYPSMRELAEDLRAYLEGRVVRAHCTGALATVRKWVTRHRALTVALGALFTTLVVALIVVSLLLKQAERRSQRLQAAHIDSQRRINATLGRRYYRGRVTSFRDDFSGEHVHRRWVTRSDPDRLTLRDGALALEAVADRSQPAEVGLDESLGLIHDDFDVRVGFRLQGFEVPTVPRGELKAALRIYISTGGADATVTIERCAELDPSAEVGAEQSYRSTATDPATQSFRAQQSVAADDREGVFRITREGNLCRTFFYQNGWRELLCVPCQTSPALLRLRAECYYEQKPFRFLIDDVEVKTHAAAELPVDDLDDRFDTDELDERYVVFSESGLVAPVAGRLDLETFAGGGNALLELDNLRWMLADEFEFEIELTLQQLASPPEGVDLAGVHITVCEGSYFASLHIEARDGQVVARAWDHRHEVVRPLRGSTVGVRFVRRGSDLETWIRQAGEWERLISRPHVGAGVRFGFLLRLHSHANSPGALVSFDNLRTRSLRPR